MATGFPTASTVTAVTTVAALYEKTNTDVKTGIKLTTEEAKWFRSYPREQITISGNENRVPLILTQPTAPAMIGDGGWEARMNTVAPTSGTFMPVQMNQRFGYTGLAQALSNRARGAMIEDQTAYQAQMAVYSFGRAIGLQTYGTSVGTVALVKTTQSSGSTVVIPLKDAFGSSSLCAGSTSAELAYLSSLFRIGDRVACISGSTLVEFGTVTAASGGNLSVTFAASMTATAGDKIVFANGDTDITISGTDYNNWPIGFTDALLTDSVLGVTTTSYAAWGPGSTASASQRLSFAVKEKMLNECYNASGATLNRFIVPQGVRRDAIAQELGGRRYDSATTDIEGDMKSGSGQQYFTSQLAIPGTLIGWYDQAYRKIELSDLPEDGGGKSIFKLDKVQGKSAIAASYDYFYAKIPSSRAAMGYASNLTSQ